MFSAPRGSFQVFRTLWVVVMALGEEKLDNIMVASCAFGGAAVLMAALGIRGSGSRSLKLYILLTVASISLPFIPAVITGQLQKKVAKDWDFFQQTGDFKAIFLVGLQLLQECAANIVQIFGIITAMTLNQTLATKKKL
ncbi:hypothetical protein O6H91_11G079800 [Diphasiastrum complanatum]|uniref:Uncharacterized protein n=1 Tax=Diphasiastrum complanatum TaxID=34168 RepID=A0ACC2CB53_DIPCM|nr:hypothetical protein O6H91_11G079800 [Diphasiastrum complanatum]